MKILMMCLMMAMCACGVDTAEGTDDVTNPCQPMLGQDDLCTNPPPPPETVSAAQACQEQANAFCLIASYSHPNTCIGVYETTMCSTIHATVTVNAQDACMVAIANMTGPQGAYVQPTVCVAMWR